MESPWNPALIQARILRSSMTSADPVPHATSLPEAPHPAKSEIFCKTVSGRVMVRTWAETWERGELKLEWVMGLEGSGVRSTGRSDVEVRRRVREGEGGEGRRVECGRSKGGERNNTKWVGGEVGQMEVRECGEGWIRVEFGMKWGQRVHPLGVSNV
jgi:hypothetical protein